MPNPYQDELQRNLTDPRTMADAIANRRQGETAGRDMSWMDRPGALTVSGQQAPAGFDQKNWNDPNMRSVKYDAGRMLAGRSRPSEIAGIVGSADFQNRFKGATFDGKDRINFNGALSDGASGVPVYDIDVLMAADRDKDSSNGFWWGHDVAGMNQGPAGGAPTSNTMPVSNAQASPGQSDLLAQILADLQAQQEPDPQMLLQQAMR